MTSVPAPKGIDLPSFSGFRTLERLGEGGMCVVYRVREEATGIERALKVLVESDTDAVRQFAAEGRLLERISHPHVVRVHHVAADAHPPWIVMDLLGGGDLEESLAREGPMEPSRAARMFADLASGLAAVHAIGVRHRDVKPANVRLGGDGIARLIDFGIAAEATEAHHARHGMLTGTASYLPPEIFVEVDAQAIQDTEAADVYALGQTLSEVLSGRPLFTDDGSGTEAILVRVMRAKLDQPFLDPRETGVKVPEGLCAIVRRATARDPLNRTPTARQLEDELREWLLGPEARASEGHPTQPPPPPPQHAAPLTRRSARAAWLAAFLLALTLAALASVFASP